MKKTTSKPNTGNVGSTAPHKRAKRVASNPAYPLVYREKNNHPRNGQCCKESLLVPSPENMIAVVFEDGGRLVTLRRNVHELDQSTEPAATDRKFWGTR